MSCDYPNARKYYNQALALAKALVKKGRSLERYRCLSDAYENLASMYEDKDYDLLPLLDIRRAYLYYSKSLKAEREAFDIAMKELTDESDIEYAYFRLTDAYDDIIKLIDFGKAKLISKKKHERANKSYCKGRYENLQKLCKAEPDYLEHFRTSDELAEFLGIKGRKEHLGEAWFHKTKYSLAKKEAAEDASLDNLMKAILAACRLSQYFYFRPEEIADGDLRSHYEEITNLSSQVIALSPEAVYQLFRFWADGDLLSMRRCNADVNWLDIKGLENLLLEAVKAVEGDFERSSGEEAESILVALCKKLGYAYSEKQCFEKAVPFYERAADICISKTLRSSESENADGKIDPARYSNVDAFCNLFKVYSAMGNREKEKKLFERISELLEIKWKNRDVSPESGEMLEDICNLFGGVQSFEALSMAIAFASKIAEEADNLAAWSKVSRLCSGLARFLSESGDNKAACTYYEKSADIIRTACERSKRIVVSEYDRITKAYYEAAMISEKDEKIAYIKKARAVWESLKKAYGSRSIGWYESGCLYKMRLADNEIKFGGEHSVEYFESKIGIIRSYIREFKK